MLEDKTKERDESYRCRLCQNKTRDIMDRIGAIYATRQKQKDVTNCIGSVYSGRENERMRWIV